MPVVINGSNGISGADGSASTPAIQGSDNNTGVFFPAADTAAIATNGTERMRIDSSGNVGIGTSSPVAKLNVKTLDATTTAMIAGTTIGARYTTDSAGIYIDGTDPTGAASYQPLYVGGSVLGVRISGTERMRITSNGGVSFGASGTAYGSSGQVLVSNGDTTPTWGSSVVSGTVQATTSGTTKDFTGIPSWVKRITVMFAGVSLSGTSSVLVQIGSGSVTTTGYTSNGNDLNMTSGTGGLSSTAGMVVSMNNAARSFSGHMMLTNISGNIWVSSHYGAGVGTSFSNVGGGNVTLSGTLDRVRITTVNGTDTFDAGSINILYE